MRAGNERFAAGRRNRGALADLARRAELVEGQNPFARGS